MTQQPDQDVVPDEQSAGAEAPPPIYLAAERQLREAWEMARLELRAKREQRDALNDEIRGLARDEDVMRQAYSVFAKEAKKHGTIDTENSR